MTNNSSQKRYPDELKERAVKMVLELQREDPNDHGVFSRVARELGYESSRLRCLDRSSRASSRRTATSSGGRSSTMVASTIAREMSK